MIYLAIVLVGVLLYIWSSYQKMSDWEYHKKECKKLGITPDQSLLPPR
jgi:uncharacterized membrane protein